MAQPGDGQVRLSWDPPATLADGSPAPATLVYDVFRATAPGAPGGRPLNTEPVAGRQYVDLAVQNDVTYHYTVRARLGPGGPESVPSAIAAATPEDRTPPAQPRGLVAVVAGPQVRLAWQPVADADVAGYLVYRSTTAGRGHTKLTPAPQGGTTYVDTDVRPGPDLLLRGHRGRPRAARQRVRAFARGRRDAPLTALRLDSARRAMLRSPQSRRPRDRGRVAPHERQE